MIPLEINISNCGTLVQAYRAEVEMETIHEKATTPHIKLPAALIACPIGMLWSQGVSEAQLWQAAPGFKRKESL